MNKDQIIEKLLAEISNLETLIADLRSDHELLVSQMQDLRNEVEYRHNQIIEQVDHTQTALQRHLENTEY